MNNKKKTSKFDGYANIKKHSTVEEFGGLDYHTIADIMSEIGDPMEHSTARNAFLNAMRKFAREIGAAHGDVIDANKACLDPAFQEFVGELIESTECRLNETAKNANHQGQEEVDAERCLCEEEADDRTVRRRSMLQECRRRVRDCCGSRL